jgi:hypothetical protein
MTTQYHKIDAPFMRDPVTHKLDMGKWCRPDFEYLANNKWEFTEKVDGTNIRLELKWDDKYDLAFWHYGGRTDNAQIPPALLESLKSIASDTAFDIENIMRERQIKHMVLYGEGYGARIQGGGKYSATPQFVVFDIKVGDVFLLRTDVNDFCSKVGLDSVPVLGYGTLNDAIQMVRYGTKTVDGEIINVNQDGAMDRLSSRWGDFEAEGIVARTAIPLFNRAGNRIITKIKSKDFR